MQEESDSQDMHQQEPPDGWRRMLVNRSEEILHHTASRPEIQFLAANKLLCNRLVKYKSHANLFMSAVSLAESGFIPLDQGSSTDAVVCVWCGLTLKDFTEHVDAIAIHQTYSYDCQYLRQLAAEEREGSWQLATYDMELEEQPDRSTNAEDGPLSFGPNVTGLQEISGLERYNLFVEHRFKKEISLVENTLMVKRTDTLEYELVRKETFANSFFTTNDRGYMAACGLFWRVVDNCVACGFCNWRWNMTAEEEIPLAKDIVEKHLKDSAGSNCRFNTGKNIPSVLNPSVWQGKPPEMEAPQTAQLQLLGVNTHFSKHSEFAVTDRRLATFLTYPYGNGQSRDELAETGYFYSGDGDGVTCFSCGVVSSNWLTAEVPWQRHARSSPSCQYLAGIKGADFASQVIEQMGSYTFEEPGANQDPTITAQMFNPRIELPAVQRALARGLERSKVKYVVSKRIQRGETDFRYTADIVKAVHDLDVPSTAHINKPNLPSHELPAREEHDAKQTDELPSEPEKNVDPLVALMTPEAFRTVSSQLTCKVCLSEIVGIGFLPCGHLMCCIACAFAMVQCPLCRKDIIGTLKANMPRHV